MLYAPTLYIYEYDQLKPYDIGRFVAEFIAYTPTPGFMPLWMRHVSWPLANHSVNGSSSIERDNRLNIDRIHPPTMDCTRAAATVRRRTYTSNSADGTRNRYEMTPAPSFDYNRISLAGPAAISADYTD